MAIARIRWRDFRFDSPYVQARFIMWKKKYKLSTDLLQRTTLVVEYGIP